MSIGIGFNFKGLINTFLEMGNNINKSYNPWLVFSVVLAIIFVFATFSPVSNYNSNSFLIKSDKQIKSNSNVTKNSFKNIKCYKLEDQIKIYTYIFHYIIPDKFVDIKNKTEYGNSLSPEYFESILKRLYNERLIGNIFISNFSDLESYQKRNCYPSKNIVIMTADDGWDDGFNYLFPLAKKYKIPFVLAIIYNKVSRLPSEINNFLNEGEINEMLKSGIITIASHTNNHFDLRRLPIDKKTDEICKSKANLEGLFNISVNTIIYPSGKYDPDTLAISKKCNYTYGFTTGVKAVGIADLKSKPFELTRIRINRKTNLNAAMNFGGHTTSTGILSSAAK